MAAEPASKRNLSERRFKDESKPTRVKDDVKPTSLKREAESQDQSYIFPSNSRNHSVDSHQPRQRKKQKLQVSPIRANILAIPDHERRYDRTCNTSSRIELSIDDRCETPLESTPKIPEPESQTETKKTEKSRAQNRLRCRFHAAVTSVEVMAEFYSRNFTIGRTRRPLYDRRIKKKRKRKKRPSSFDAPPIENIHLPSDGRDSSAHLDLLSSWQNFILDEGHKEVNNSCDKIPQNWGWSSSPDDKIGNELRVSRVRTERMEKLLAELKLIDFDPDMGAFPKSRDPKNVYETAWDEIETESEDEQTEHEAWTSRNQPNRFFMKTSSSQTKGRSKNSYTEENYQSLFRPEEPEEEKSQETKSDKLKRLGNENWDMFEDDISRRLKDQFYFCRSLKHECGEIEPERIYRSDSFEVLNISKSSSERTSHPKSEKADTKSLINLDKVHEMIREEELMAFDYNHRLGIEERFFERRKKSRNVFRMRAWQYDNFENRDVPHSIYDIPDYDDRHDMRNHLQLFETQYLGYLPGDALALEYICDERMDETFEQTFNEQTGELYTDFKEDEEGHLYGVSFREGNNWAYMDPIVQDMISVLVRECYKSLQELELDILARPNRFFEKMASNQRRMRVPVILKGRVHTGLAHITMLLKIAADLALARIEVRLELTSNPSFTRFYNELFLIGRPHSIVPFVRREDWNAFVKAVLGFLTVLLGNPTVCMCDPSDSYFEEVFAKLGAQFWAGIYRWVICLVAYGFKYKDREYLDFLKPRLIAFARVYENCQYRRYRARKNYNLALFKDAAEDNLEPEVLNELADDQKEFLESLDLTNPVDSLHETEKHRTHGLLHVIEKLTCLGSIPYSNYIFDLWGRAKNPQATYDSFNFSQKHDHLMQTQWLRPTYRRFFPMAEHKMDNTAINQFIEFFHEALANLKKLLPENYEMILKDGPCKKEHIEALREFAHCVQQFTNIATLSFRASIGVTGLLEKKLEAFNPIENYNQADQKMIKSELENLEYGYTDQLQKNRLKIRLMIKPIEELVEPYLVFLPAQVRHNWDRFHDIAFPKVHENGIEVPLPIRTREERARTRSARRKPKLKKYIILSRAVARNEKQVVKNYNTSLYNPEEVPDIFYFPT